jgi:hypothetical protein
MNPPESPKCFQGVSGLACGDTNCSRWVLLQVDEHVGMMYIHVFAACFGLTVAWYFLKPLCKGLDKKAQRERVQMATIPSLFAMLGKNKVDGWAPA